MTTEAKIQLTSSELGTLWMTYIAISARLIIFDTIKNKTIDKKAQKIISAYITDAQIVKNDIVNMFDNENAVIPLGFNESDVNREVPPLFDDIFNITFLRKMMKLNLGHDGVFSAITYMKEVNDLFKLNFEISNKYYMMTTNYLLEKGTLSKPPCETMPKSRIY